ncbi:MAG: hypothetical protein GXO25_04285, partial [Euryarchaeota archaeon]|nr:hypothetical protein [Euryarchaeota archaeon]
MLPVPFVGPLRSEILERAGYTLDKLKHASIDEVANLDGFSNSLAKNIIKYSNLVDTATTPPEELIFDEFRCPACGAIVSKAEPVCHSCGHTFFEHPDNYQEIMDKIATVIAKLYQNPDDSRLWREGEKLFTQLGNEMIASDFKFKASSLELKNLETPTPVVKKPKKIGAPKPGYTNGLVNGLSVNSHEVHKPVREGKIRVVIIGLIIILPVLLAGVLTFGTAPAIVIDGHFEDWKDIPAHGGISHEFTTFKMKTYGENTFIYVQGPGLFSTKNFKLGILIDQDSSPKTGFPVNRMGVDAAIWIYSVNGTQKARVLRFEDDRWESSGTVNFAISGHAVELMTFKILEHSSILLYYSSREGVWYSSIYTPINHIWAVSTGGEVLEPGKPVTNVTLWNSGTGTAKINSLTLKNIGNTSAKVTLQLKDLSEEVTISSNYTHISFTHPIEIGTVPIVMKILYSGGGKKYGTLQPYLLSSENFTFINRAQGAYISAIPAQKAIDGIFLDWKDAFTSPRSALPINVDLSKYASDNTANLKIYISVYGTLFGTGVPVIKTENGNNTGGNVTNNTRMPEDTLEIYVDSDKNPHTGFKIGNIGAEYRVLIYGKLGAVNRIQAYRWFGRWVAVDMPLKYAKNDNSMEIGLTLRGNVYYRLVNWEGIW